MNGINTTSASTQNVKNPDRNNLPAYKYASLSPRNRRRAIRADRLRACLAKPAQPITKANHTPVTPMNADRKARLDAAMAEILAGRVAA